MSTGAEDDVRRILRRIRREAGLDPDGPARPMKPKPPTSGESQRVGEIAYRDAMLRRSLKALW